ncbi:hemagglutinin repeat-containing protein [Cupriavidus sp. 2MCAB6]|uniref:hemagglutinin repeat-containing protein n=1 Tax=Cupriavidus sp. 2MCAB6 TaxID=3232981 RepID=UPI003F9229A5
MNKNLYRIIFNRARGMLQVVAEIARGHSSGGGGRGIAASRPCVVMVRPLNFAVWVIMGHVVLGGTALAQVVADPSAPGNQRPTVLLAPNGTPLVNIQTPSAAGVSRNTYQQFDVGQQGAILNNSRGNTQTQLGGWVQGNPWLGKGTAKVILNEVNSSNPSRLNGYVEIAGSRAQLVIANPAGISCDGCGFINANRLTLTTGTPVVNGGSLEGYRVEGGALRVQGKGLDASGADYTDVIARSMEVNAGIWASQLQVTTGVNDVSADHTRVAAKAAGGKAPAFAVDVSSLGGMYSQKIVLLGTEHGVGVRNAGNLGTQAGELVVTADGRLENSGAMQARTDTRVNASGGVANAGTLSAGRELVVNTPQDVDNRGGTLNGRRVEVNAQSLANRDGAIEQTGVQNLALRVTVASNRHGGRIGLVEASSGGGPGSSGNGGVPGSGSEGGSTSTGGIVEVDAGTAPAPHPPARLADGALNIAKTLDNDGGRIFAGGAIDLAASGGLNNDGGHLGVRQLSVSGGDLANRSGELHVSDAASIRAGQVSNDDGRLQLGGALTFTADNLSNRAGAFLHGGTDATHLQVADTLDNSDGTLVSNASQLSLSSRQLINQSGKLNHAGDAALKMQVDTLNGKDGQIATAGAAAFKLGSADHRNASLSAARIDLTAESFDNRGGKIVASGEHGNRLHVAGSLDNSQGTIATNGDLSIRASTFGNADGTVQHAGNGRLDIAAGTLNGAGGTLASNGALTLTGETTDLFGGTILARKIEIDTGKLTSAAGSLSASGTDALDVKVRGALDNHGGTIAGNGALDLNAKSLGNRDGNIQAAGAADTRLAVAETLDNTGGTLAAAGDTAIQAGTLHNQGGTLQAAGEAGLDVRVDGRLDNRDGGVIVSGGAGQVTAGSLDNRGGTLNARGTLTVSASEGLDNRAGKLVSHGDLGLTTGSLDNRDGGLVASTKGGVTVDSRGRTDNAGGTLQAAGGLALDSTGLGNAAGTVLGANLRIDTRQAALDNAHGTLASTAGRLDIRSGAFDNTAGLLQSAGALGLSGGDLDNRAGVLHSQGDLAAQVGTLDNRNGGQFSGNAGVCLDGSALQNQGGKVQASKKLTVTLTGTADNHNGLMAAGDDLGVNADTILNRDTQSADPQAPLGLQGGTVALAGNRIDNTAGTIAADRHIGITGAGVGNTLDNTGGSVSSAGSIAVTANRIVNSAGTLLSGTRQSIEAGGMAGDGRVLSKGDLTVALQQAFDNSGEITANGRALISTAGRLTNRSTLQAGDLEVRGSHVDNTASGQISGGRTLVAAGGTLGNRGLIDGGRTRIEAGTLDNVGTGRIYGDHVGIQAGSVLNREEHANGQTKAAAIAARQRLDIGAGVVNNREQALIFSAGGGSDAMNIGGALDAEGHATGRAGLLLNDSATIESLGGLTIDASRLRNGNLHFGAEVVQVGGPTKGMYLQPNGDPNKHDIGDFAWERWSKAGLYRNKQTGAEVKAWTQYDITRTEYETQVTQSAPALMRSGGNMTLRGDELTNDRSHIFAGGALQGDLHNLKNEQVFGEHIQREQGTSQYTYSRWRGGFKWYHERKWDGRIAYTPADTIQTIPLNVSKAQQHTASNGSGYSVGGRNTGGVGGTIAGGSGTSGGASSREIIEVAAAVGSVSGPGTLQGQDAASADGPGASTSSSVGAASGNDPAVIRTVGVDTQVPTNSLFRVQPDSGSYLIETDPRFANYRNWLSSDYLLSQLGYDPAAMHKRLGDGFYEQGLVRDQIGQLTGRRFLQGYGSDEAQYRALLEAGGTYAKAWSLRPGVALSAEQMAQLTSDMVWLVEQDVTLADGTRSRALVPQVYVRVKPGDLNGNGTLIAADSIDLELKGDLVNSGTIAGRTAVKLTGENLRNLGGRITGDAVALKARNDLDNIGGTLDAGKALSATAGRDLNVVTTIHSDAKRAGLSDFSRTHIDRAAGLYVSNPGGTLVAMAGRDANLMAAQIINAGKDGKTAIVAGRDLNLGTVQVAEQENNVRNTSNYLKQGHGQDVGTTVRTEGDVRLQAVGDLNARAANVTSDKGALVAVAQGDVNIVAGEAGSTWSEGRKHKSSGLFGSTTKTSRNSVEETNAVASTFSGNTVAVQGQNVTVTGSNVVSDARTVIVAKNDLRVEAATNTRSESHFKRTDKTGFLYNGGVAITLGSQMQSVGKKDMSTSAAASTVGATGGSVTLVAGNHYQQTGSHVLAPKGDIDIHARKVDIVETRESGRSTEESKFRQSGLTVAVTAPVISALQAAEQMKSAAGKTEDPRMKALAAATTVLTAKNTLDTIKADPKAAGGLNISITVGGSKSDSKFTSTRDTAVGSTVAAGGDVRISATGAGQDSDLTVQGSRIRAGGNAHLKADGDLTLLAAQNTNETDRKSSSASGGVGVAISVGSNGVGFGVTANASGSKGKGEGKDVTWSNAHVNAGERLTLESGGDTTLRGAVASGKQVVADVGGNLNIESLQDTSTFKSKDQSLGGSVTVGVGFAASASYSNSKVDGDFASVRGQSGIQAGDGGFDVKVKGNTDLKGAAIASTDQAVKDGLNRVSTGTLTVSDIENRSKHKATGVSLSGGFSVSGDDKKADGKETDKQSESSKATNVAGKGSDWSLQNFGNSVGAGAPGYSRISGSDSSVTRSGISGGAIEARNETEHKAMTGKTVEETVASINRDILIGDSANGLVKDWDAGKLVAQVQAQAEIAAAFSQQAYTAVDSYVKTERAELQARLKQVKTTEEKAVVEAELKDLKLQERVMNVLIGAVTGSGTSAVTKETLSAAASKMRELMIEDSAKFAGVTDGQTTINNISGESVGSNGDGVKLGGTRIDLEKLCGKTNERCLKKTDGSLDLDDKKQVQFDNGAVGMSLAEFLGTEKGKEMGGLTGGIQGVRGTLFGVPYGTGSWQDRLIESFAGTHDMIGGKLGGLYDEEGNAKRERSLAVKVGHEAWSIAAIPISGPFAMAEALPPEVWQAISLLLKSGI